MGTGVGDRRGGLGAQRSTSPMFFPDMAAPFDSLCSLLTCPLLVAAFLGHPLNASLYLLTLLYFLSFTVSPPDILSIHLFSCLSYQNVCSMTTRDFVLFTARVDSQCCQLVSNLALVKFFISLYVFHRVALMIKCADNKAALGTVPSIS